MDNKKTDQSEIESFLGTEKVIINIGIKIFEDSLASQGAEVVTVTWSPPSKNKERINSILDELL